MWLYCQLIFFEYLIFICNWVVLNGGGGVDALWKNVKCRREVSISGFKNRHTNIFKAEKYCLQPAAQEKIIKIHMYFRFG